MATNTFFSVCAAVLVGSSVTVFTQAKATPTLDLQVQLARAGSSTGEIDGVDGANTKKALAAHMEIHRAAPDATGETLEDYVLTAEDVAGPFITIPKDMMAKAKLKSLGYTSLMEALGEQFRTAPALLKTLNPGVEFVAGATIKVPKVDRGGPADDKAPADAAGDVTVVVSKSESSLRVYTSTGSGT